MILVEAFLGNGDDDDRQKEHIFRKFWKQIFDTKVNYGRYHKCCNLIG